MATKRVRRIDQNGDVTFGRGQANYADKAEATAQRCVTGTRLNLGEWFLDTEDGVPWWQADDSEVQPILGGKHDLGYASAVLKRRILSRDGVKELKDFELHDDSTRARAVAGSAAIVTVDGDIENIQIESP